MSPPMASGACGEGRVGCWRVRRVLGTAPERAASLGRLAAHARMCMGAVPAP